MCCPPVPCRWRTGPARPEGSWVAKRSWVQCLIRDDGGKPRIVLSTASNPKDCLFVNEYGRRWETRQAPMSHAPKAINQGAEQGNVCLLPVLTDATDYRHTATRIKAMSTTHPNTVHPENKPRPCAKSSCFGTSRRSRYEIPVPVIPTFPVALPSLRFTDAPGPPTVHDVPDLLRFSVSPLKIRIRF